MFRIAILILLSSALGLLATGGPDPFERIKSELAEADCCHVRFLSIVHSDVFESVDTTSGQAYVARDGRYAINLGQDTYVQTDDKLYSYSEPNNQVTVELVDAGSGSAEEVSFLNRLDHYFHTNPVEPGKEYNLIRIDTASSGLPDSMKVFLSEGGRSIARMEYFDINHDRNTLSIISLEALPRCDSLSLRPSFPDTVQIITLY